MDQLSIGKQAFTALDAQRYRKYEKRCQVNKGSI